MPLKRHPVLQDYSREHHDELLFAWKIRQGLKKNIFPQRIIDYCNFHLKELTLPHMEKEEKYILPKLPDSDAGKQKILSDHAALRQMTQQFSSVHPGMNQLLFDFAEALEKHVRYEEREFFPRVQDLFDEQTLNLMQPAEGKDNECAVWDDRFWE